MDGLLDFLTTVVPRGACVVFVAWRAPGGRMSGLALALALGVLLLAVCSSLLLLILFFFFVGGYVLGGGHLPHAWFMFVSYLCALTCVCMTV